MPRTPRQPPDDARILALTRAVEELSQHIESLYEVIDEFRLDFAALLERHAPPTPLVVNRFPRETDWEKWNERVKAHALGPVKMEGDISEPSIPTTPVQQQRQQRQLWDEQPAESFSLAPDEVLR